MIMQRLKVGEHWAVIALEAMEDSNRYKDIIKKIQSSPDRGTIREALRVAFFKGCGAGERKLLSRGQGRGKRLTPSTLRNRKYKIESKHS
jgi:hypothetical protein